MRNREHEKRGNITHEGEQEDALAKQLADKLEQQAGPGAYLNGKRLVGTTASEQQMTLHFEGAWDLVITGTYRLQLLENNVPAGDDPDTIEGEAYEETEMERRLLGNG